jgi:hypothetical protein
MSMTETSVAEDSSSYPNELLAKFCLHFFRCILTEYFQAWRLRVALHGMLVQYLLVALVVLIELLS